MKADVTSPADARRSLGVIAGRLALLLLLPIGVSVMLGWLMLRAGWWDLQLLALFLLLSGGLSLGFGALAIRFGGSLRLSIWSKIALAHLVGTVVALINVALTAYLMFINVEHDLPLLTLLLLFALVVSLAFGSFVADSIAGRLRLFAAGARRMAAGDLSVRVDPRGSDEIGELARAFNYMAAQLEASFARQRELEQARRDLVAAVSHDLRTPLASVRVMVEALLDGVVTDAETTDRYLRAVQTQVGNLAALIDDLFELSQIDAGAIKLQLESIRVRQLVAETLAGFAPQAQSKGLRLAEAGDDPEPVALDPHRIQRVLFNLVQNAIRHTPADGSIMVAVHDIGDEVEVRVSDSGEGVEDRDLPHLFERFYRGEKSRSREHGGAGLGLAIARGLVEAHGGRIWVESAPGRGSTFGFVLPKAPALAGTGRS